MLNKTIIEGRLTRDPELRTVGENNAVCHFTIATQRNYRKEGEYLTDFFEAVAWRKKAELVSTYFRKGSRIILVGAFETRKYTDKNDQPRTAIELQVEEVYFAEYGKPNSNAPATEPAHFSHESSGDFTPDFTVDEDIPF